MTRRCGWMLALLALTATVAAAGQARRPGKAARAEGRREKAFRVVDAYVIRHLQESLALSDEQYVQALPLVRKLQADRRHYWLERGRLLREMHRLLHAGGGNEGVLIEELAELKRIEEEGPARVRSDTEALDAALTPLQQAKFRLLEAEVERRMRELMSRVRGRPGRSPRD